jgi:ATP synthase F0 subunit b
MLGPVSLSLPTLIIEAIIFLAMVRVMEALVFDPIRRAWADRDRQIQEGLASSNEGRDEAEQARAEVRRLLAEARQAAQRQIDHATEAGGRVRDEAVAQATAEFRRLIDQARERISSQRQRDAEALEQRIVDIALEAARRVTGQAYDQQQVRELAAAVVSREGLR